MSEPKNRPEPESKDVSKPAASIYDEIKAVLEPAARLFESYGMMPSPIAWSGEVVAVLVGELCGERHAMFVHLDIPATNQSPAGTEATAGGADACKVSASASGSALDSATLRQPKFEPLVNPSLIQYQ